jgi:hypothetical protein
MPVRLGQMLVRRGLISPAELDLALARQAERGGRLGSHLIALGLLTPNELAALLRVQREVEAALPGARRALAKLEAGFGDAHPNTLRARYNLARLLLVAGEPEAASRQAETALASYTRLYGAKHHWTRDCARLAAQAKAALDACAADCATMTGESSPD